MAGLLGESSDYPERSGEEKVGHAREIWSMDARLRSIIVTQKRGESRRCCERRRRSFLLFARALFPPARKRSRENRSPIIRRPIAISRRTRRVASARILLIDSRLVSLVDRRLPRGWSDEIVPGWIVSKCGRQLDEDLSETVAREVSSCLLWVMGI